MLQNLKKRQEGFTIIEVMIVLVIAAVILLIVFLAVPALQRNSRNTQIKNDVGIVLGYVNEYASNNNGNLPGSICSSSGFVNMIADTTGCTATSSANVGKVNGGTTVSNGTAMPSNTNTITVYLNRKCNGNAFAGSSTNRAIAAGFLVETAGGSTAQCQDG